MTADYLQGVNRRCTPDTTHQATPSEGAELRLVPLHLVDPLMHPAVRKDVLTLPDTANIAKTECYLGNKHYHGTLAVLDRGYYEQITLHLDILPYTKGHYSMGNQYYL